MVVGVKLVKDTKMQTPTTPTTYTTIPIPGGDVISRSIQNLSTCVSRRRPWPEFIASGVFDRPDSLSSAGTRIRKNATYFRINYSIIVSACAALSLIGLPISLIVFALIFGLWLILYFFREDPLVVTGYHVSDRVVLAALLLASVVAIWFLGVVWNMLLGIGIGILISGIHGIFRNPQGLFLDEDEAVSKGLIGSGSPSTSHYHRVDFTK